MAKTFTGVLMEAQGAFGGRVADIPIPDDVRQAVVDELKDPDPMYITLPIGKVDSRSRNGRTYPRAAMESMVEAINSGRPSGQLGHLRESDRPYAFNVGPLRWMAARIESDGTVMGKAYVMPFAEDVRQYIKMAKISRAPIGTSLYGMGETDDEDRVISLQIESIDLVDPSRVGVREAAVIPTITSESFDPTRAAEDSSPTQTNNQKKDNPVDPEVKTPPAPAPVSETETERKHTEAVRLLNETITKQKHELEDYRQIVAELKNPADPVTAVRVLQESNRQLTEENVALLQETIEAHVNKAVKLETVRPIVLTMVKKMKPKTRHEVTRFVQETVDSDEIKALLEAQRVAEAGEPHKRPPQTDKKPDAKADDFYVPAY